MKARTMGECIALNRLLEFHTVRSTKAVMHVPPMFVVDPAYASLRTEKHRGSSPDYPDPLFMLRIMGHYYLRGERLWHLRIEQFVRYCALFTGTDADEQQNLTIENTRDEDDVRLVERNHRHYDEIMENEPVGKKFPALFKGVAAARRRMHSRLGVSRVNTIEPIGESRERHYQQRLLLGLPWFAPACPDLVEEDGKRAVRWTLEWARPVSLSAYALPAITLQLSSARAPLSFEEECHNYEKLFASSDLNLVCPCCAGEMGDGPCSACRYALGFHVCPENEGVGHRWRPGTLSAGLLP